MPTYLGVQMPGNGATALWIVMRSGAAFELKMGDAQ